MDPVLAEMKELGAQTLPKDPAPAAEPAPAKPADPAPAPAAEPAKKDPTPAEPAPAAKADEPKPAEVKPAEEPAAAVDNKIDFVSTLKEKSSGRIDSDEALIKIIQERDEFEERLRNAPVLDDYTLKLDAWKKKGFDVELFHTIHDLPIDELSSEDKVKASLKLQNPEWMEDDINVYLKNKYGILAPEDEGYDENKARYGKMQLDIDAKTADQELRSLQGMTVFSQEDEQAAAQAEGQRQQAWSTGLPKIATDFTKISLALDAEGKHIFDYVPTEAQKAKVVQSLQKAIKNAPVAYDENGIKAVNDLFRKEFRDQNFNEIVRAAATRMATIQKEANIERVHNPSGKAEPEPVKPVEKSPEETTMAQIDGFLGNNGKR